MKSFTSTVVAIAAFGRGKVIPGFAHVVVASSLGCAGWLCVHGHVPSFIIIIVPHLSRSLPTPLECAAPGRQAVPARGCSGAGQSANTGAGSGNRPEAANLLMRHGQVRERGRTWVDAGRSPRFWPAAGRGASPRLALRLRWERRRKMGRKPWFVTAPMTVNQPARPLGARGHGGESPAKQTAELGDASLAFGRWGSALQVFLESSLQRQ